MHRHRVQHMPDTMRVWLLSEFRVSSGVRTIDNNAWGLRKAAAIVKLLALSPGHRLHREQVIDILWPTKFGELMGCQASSSALRFTRRRWELDSPRYHNRGLSCSGQHIVILLRYLRQPPLHFALTPAAASQF
jgi:hypothetical protein